jgi:imidazole glycerol-phosphate synthase subunit HisF
MRETRVIPVVLLDGKRAVKTMQFRDSTYVGDPINIIRLFSEKSVDELMVLDITASARRANPDFNFLRSLATQAFMP